MSPSHRFLKPGSPPSHSSGAPREAAGGARACVVTALLALLTTVARADAPGSVPGIAAADSLALARQYVRGVDSLLAAGQGYLPAARVLAERAVALRETFGGGTGADTALASALTGLARVRAQAGDYAGAIAAAERSVDLLERPSGPAGAGLPSALAALARPLAATGDNGRARALEERALALAERSLGPDDPNVAGILRDLGSIHLAQGDRVGAQPLLERALAIEERSLGPSHPEVARTLDRLAVVLQGLGRPLDARKLLVRALDIREHALGRDHPEVAETLLSLATWSGGSSSSLRVRLVSELVRSLGPAEKDLLDRASEICEKSLGPDHPETGRALALLTYALLNTGENERALRCALRAEEIGRDQLRLALRALDERQALRYAASRVSGLDAALPFAVEGVDPGVRARVWDSLVRSRSLVLDETAARHRLASDTRDPVVARLARELHGARERLASLFVRGPGADGSGAYLALVGELRQAVDRAERSLAEKSAAFRGEQARSVAGLQEVVSALPAGSALVSYVRYARREATGPVRHYAAFVERADGHVAVAVDLGRADEIDFAVGRWSREAGRGTLVSSRSPAQMVAAYRIAGLALRRRVWDPIAPALAGVDRVLVCPDGALSLVSLATLPADSAGYLLETGPLVHYISAERDLVAHPVAGGAEEASGTGLLALGGPDFDGPATELVGPPAPSPNRADAGAALAGSARAAPGTTRSVEPEAPEGAGPYKGPRPDCPDLARAHFAPLPGTSREVEEIARLWPAAAGPVICLRGHDAGEAAFKERAPGRRVIHLATHGFFLSGRCPSAFESGRGASAAEAAAAADAADNPLLFSGLALAGANLRDRAPGGAEDGILTAEEIGSLDLRGTEWAVLSACETGVGEVQAGEGVLGLRRAFQVAGAATLLMSLWSVDDESTRQWMDALYEARFAERLDTAEAVRTAALRVLAARRAAGQSEHPFYWGAFIATGSWK